MIELIAVVSIGALIVVWLGYPLLIAGLARRRHDAMEGERSPEPTVSVIIATRDDPEAIRARIANCAESTYDPAKIEIIIGIDPRRASAKHDVSALCATASSFGRCTVVLGDEPGGKAATLNAAVRASRGEVLIFTDTHQRFDPDAIPHFVSLLEDPRVGASSGSLELPPSGKRSVVGRYWLLERWLRRCEARVHSSVGVTGAIWALRRNLWKTLPASLILDDVYTPMRVVLEGYRVAFVESARAVETRLVAVRQEYRRKLRTLTGVTQLLVMLPRVLLPRRNPIWAQFMCHKLLRLLTPYWVLAVMIWIASLAMPWLIANPDVALGGTIPLAAGSLLAPARRVMKRAGNGVISVALLQAAAVVAVINGFRRRWDVWS